MHLQRPGRWPPAAGPACTGPRPACRWPAPGRHREPRHPIGRARATTGDVPGAAYPQLERRHRHDRILVMQRASASCHSAGRRPRSGRAVAPVGLAARRIGSAGFSSRPAWRGRAGARCSPRRRWCRGVPPPRPPASGAPRTGSARPAGGGEVLQRGDEGEPDRLAGAATSAGSPRHRPGRRESASPTCASGSTRPRRTPRAAMAGPRSMGRARAAGPEHVEADVGRDPVQPGAHAGPPLEAVERPPRPQHRLLHGVLGLEGRAEHAVAVAGQLPPNGSRSRSATAVDTFSNLRSHGGGCRPLRRINRSRARHRGADDQD